MLTLLAFVVTLGVIVSVHEYGHFQMARWCGVRVLRFSVGFGRPLLRKTIDVGRTELVLAAIPLGGYVKMLDERELKAEAEQQPDKPQPHYSEDELKQAFNRQAVYKRMLIVLAGPVANLLLAIGIYWLLMMHGETGIRPMVGDIKPNSLAAQANFVKGEEIKRVGDESVRTWQEARLALLNASLNGKSVNIETIINQSLHEHRLSLVGINNDAEEDILNKLGMEMFRPESEPIIGQVIAGGAAAKAGLQENDKILSIDKAPMKRWEEVVSVIKASPNKPLLMEVLRNNHTVEISITPTAIEENHTTIGRINAVDKVDQKLMDSMLVKIDYPPLPALARAIKKTWDTSALSLKLMWRMVVGDISWKGISGPATIAKYAGESASFGILPFIEFLAFISISIGVLNLLPIPVLDGGHFMYYIAEVIKGSPVSEQIMMAGQKIGFGLLGLLMTIAIFNDINRLFPS
jgi:regulator of sigma E protease